MSVSLRVKINSARNLPIMDRSTDLTDAFVEVRIGSCIYKTEVVRRTLNPVWNADWFFFQIHDHEINDECLQIRVFDHDTYSAHDAIGRVYFDINTILTTKKSIDGWFPIYDPMHGIRGEINLVISLDLISFASKSLGENPVKIFSSPNLPFGYTVNCLIGFVQEIVVVEDPEHQWIEKIRTPRASNEARQRLFSRISRDIRSKICKIVLNFGGNSILGFQQHFDIEGETGVVVRAIGCAAILSNSSFLNNQAICKKINLMNCGEFPFFTLMDFPQDLNFTFGSFVNVMSVKMVNKDSSVSVQNLRDAWWMELRTEMASNMRSMECNAIIGYHEECCIFDEICILWSYGTAICLSNIDTASCMSSPIEVIHPFEEEFGQDGNNQNGQDEADQRRNVSVGAVHGSVNSPSASNPIFSTCNFPDNLEFTGLPGYIQTSVCRSRRDYKGEIACRELNNVLPGIEFELHYRLAQMIKLKGFNSIFGVTISIVMSESMILAVLSGTGYHLTSLAKQQLPKVVNYEYPEKVGNDDIQVLSRKMETFRRESEAHYGIAKERNQPAEKADKINPVKVNQSLMDNKIEYMLSCRQIGINELVHFLRESFPPHGVLVSTTDTLLNKSLVANWLKTYSGKMGSEMNQPDQTQSHVQAIKKLSHPIEMNAEKRKDLWQNIERYMTFNSSEIWLADSFFETMSINNFKNDNGSSLDAEAKGKRRKSLLEKMKIKSKTPLITRQSSLKMVPATTSLNNKSSLSFNRPSSANNFNVIQSQTTLLDNQIISPHPEGCLSHALNSFNIENWSKLKETRPCLALATNMILFITQSNHLHVINIGIILKLSKERADRSLAKTKSDTGMRKMVIRESVETQHAEMPATSNSNLSVAQQQKNNHSESREDVYPPDSLVSDGQDYTPSKQAKRNSKVNAGKFFLNLPILNSKQNNSIVKRNDNLSLKNIFKRKQNAINSLEPIQMEIFTPLQIDEEPLVIDSCENKSQIIISPLTHIPNYKIDSYIGNLDMFFIRESTDLREYNGLTGFLHHTVNEIEQVISAHAFSLGANAIVSCNMTDFKVIHSSVGGNSGQCLINICGDMVYIS